MKLIGYLILLANFATMASTYGQVKLSIKMEDASLEEVLIQIGQSADYFLLFSEEDVTKVKSKISVDFKNESIEHILNSCLNDTGLNYTISNKTVIISAADQTAKKEEKLFKLKGKVTDKNGKPLPGATIIETGTYNGTVTDEKGYFSLLLKGKQPSIKVSFMGYASKTVEVGDKTIIEIVLEESVEGLDEVVVNGIYTRKQNTFTGSAVQIKGDELRTAGNQSVIKSLSIIDPSILILDNLEQGSNPNYMPKMQFRGTSSFDLEENIADLKGDYVNDPNAPLFILDGFEVSIVKVIDLNIERIESVTILKDAAAKAIYGSKAANGVIVLETKKVSDDEVRITFGSSTSIEVPDLSSYDLLSAEEKLQFEKDYGVYYGLLNRYELRRTNILAGTNTDWMSKPLRNAVGIKNWLSFQIGAKNLKLIADLSYNRINGIMKKSDRTNFEGAITLAYRYKKFRFRNQLTITSNVSNDSPYGGFYQYVIANPYESPYDKFGNLVKTFLGNSKIPNPLYNSQFNTLIKRNYIDITNNFYVEWSLSESIKSSVRLGITSKRSTADEFYPADHTRFKSKVMTEKGSYQVNEGKQNRFSGDVNIQFNKEIAKNHFVFANAGYSISENSFNELVYKATGFPSQKMNSMLFAKQYAKDSKPYGAESTTRDIGFLGALNYSYDERFLFDFSYRLSASSQFGKNKRWGQFWSVGTGWNIHNESWMNSDLIDLLKLRASVGYTGSQGVSPYSGIASYSYDLRLYDDYYGALLKGMVNNTLQWQSKYDKNIGVDVNLLKKLSVKADFYISQTENALVNLTIPTSNGFSTVRENVGKIRNKGYELKLSYTPFRNPKDRSYVSFMLTAVSNTNELVGISNAMQEHNRQVDKFLANESSGVPLKRYFEGVSMNAIWGMQSLGIDPANGLELYQYKDGSVHYKFKPSEQLIIGNSMPDIYGNFGVNAEYKGIGVTTVFTYKYGGQMYNYTLLERVEGYDIRHNLDRRVLEEAWQKPGDVAKYRTLKPRVEQSGHEVKLVLDQTKPTSRFVMDNNELKLASLSVSYDFWRHAFVKSLGVEKLKLSFHMSDVFTLSSIKIERGTSYPFSRRFNFTLTATF